MSVCVYVYVCGGHDLLRNPYGFDRGQNKVKARHSPSSDEDNFALPEQWQDGVSNSSEI